MSKDSKLGFRQFVSVTKRTFAFAFKAAGRYLVATLLLLNIVSVLPTLVNYFDAQVLESVVKVLAGDNNHLSILLVFAVSSLAVSVVIDFLWAVIRAIDAKLWFKISFAFQHTFLEKSSNLDIAHYESPEGISALNKAADTYEWRPREYINGFIWSFGDLTRVITTMFIVISFSPIAFLIVVATAIPNLVLSLKLGNTQWGIWGANAEERQRFWDASYSLRNESSIKELKIFGTQKYLLSIVDKLFLNFARRENSTQVKRSFWESIFSLFSTLGIYFFWFMAISAALRGEIGLASLSFYGVSVGNFSNSFSNLVRSISNRYNDARYIQDYFDFIDLKPKIKSGHIKIKVSNPSIEFRNVDFKYPGTDRYILRNFNLKINPKDKIALVGENGAGKSTIIKLLSRFYDVTDGEILLDGKNIANYNLEDYYKYLGILFQNFNQYGAFDVKTNIELGNIERVGDDKLVWEALDTAGATKFVNEYSNKLNQILTKHIAGGIEPSGGEWQRLALARSFFKNAAIMILDEPTSAIDAKAEAEIFEQLYKFTENKTVIIISHRFSTVRKADKIVVLEDGSIIEEGTHEELLKLNGKYAEAFNLQAKGYH